MKILAVLFLSLVGALNHEPLIRYDFSPESCENTIFPNTGRLSPSLLALDRNGNTTKCTLGYGVEAKDLFSTTSSYRMKSAHSIRPILEHYLESNISSISGVTISLWINNSFDYDDMRMGPILTVGNPRNETITTTTTTLTECDERQIDFQLSIQKNYLELLYRTSDSIFEPCRRVRFTELPLQRGGIHHVAITLGDKHQQIFLNGQPSTTSRDPFDGNLQHWNKESLFYFLSFLGDNYPAWNGRLYQFSIHEEIWNVTQVRSEISHGLPPTEPFTISKRIQVNEDAETNPGLNEIDWYRNPRTIGDVSSLQRIELPIGFVDYEVDRLLESLDLIHHSSQRLYFYITRHPSRGTLYNVDGTMLSGDTGIATLLAGDSLIFLPVHNEHSPLPGSTYTSFDFCVTTRAIFTASQCKRPGTIDIIVDSVNDPPKPIPINEPYIVHEGIYEEAFGIKLTGEDVDIGDKIVAIEVTSPPKYGDLFLSVPIFRSDGLPHGTLLSDLNYTIPGSEAIVEYLFLGTDPVVLQGLTAKDSFQFRVVDNYGTWSETTTVEIQILSSLNIASPNIVIAKEEEEPISILVHGQDKSGLNRTIGYYFETVPSKEDGVLLSGNGTQVQQNSIFEFKVSEAAYHQGFNISFEPTVGVCSNTSEANTTLSYRMVAFSEEGQIASASALIEQTIRIECSTRPLKLSISQNNYTINTFEGPADDPCSGYNYTASTTPLSQCTSAAIISDIHVSGNETHTNMVFISINALHGFLTLNREERSHIQIVGNQVEMRPSISFFVHPSKLQEVLQYLHFQTETSGEDVIQITIHCHGNEPNSSVNSHCTDVVTFIHIMALKSHVIQRRRLYGDFPWFSLSFTLSMVCLLKVRGKVRKLLAKKKADDSDLYQDCRWKEHYDENTGFYYYESLEDGTVTWEPPLEESFIPSAERTGNVITTNNMNQTPDLDDSHETITDQEGEEEEEEEDTISSVISDESF